MAIAAALAAALLAVGSSAQAQTANRAWVSGKGTDAPGCGAPTAACRSFQYVHDHIIAAGGEIDVLDGAGYGAITITKALSIVGSGAVAAVQQPNSGQDAITINAGPGDAVHLRGLTLEGLGLAFSGVRFHSGASLDVVGCVTRHFTNGLFLASTNASTVSITDTLASDNGEGIDIVPSAAVSVALKGVIADNNDLGGVNVLAFNPLNVLVSAVDTEVSGSRAGGEGFGFSAFAETSGATVAMSLSDITASNNNAGVFTLQSGGVASVTLGRSLLAGNGDGADDTNGGTIFSFGDNRFTDNGTDANGGLTAIAAK